jgi:hypothetical protein
MPDKVYTQPRIRLLQIDTTCVEDVTAGQVITDQDRMCTRLCSLQLLVHRCVVGYPLYCVRLSVHVFTLT